MLSRGRTAGRRSLAAAAALVAAGAASAQAPQRLRDPQSSVFTAFPESNGYQAVTRDVGPTAREAIERGLPFRVHFNELGPHTIYVALRDKRPLGVVYVRSEEGAWGLTEIEWAMTLDLKVVGFRFQHIRDTRKEAFVDSPFARLLAGRGGAELVALLGSDGRLLPGTQGVVAGTEDLADTLVRSALKSIVVTGTVWPGEIEKLRDLAIGMEAFTTAVRFGRIWPRADAPREQMGFGTTSVVLAVRAWEAWEQRGGLVVDTEIRGDERPAVTRWTLARDGTVVSVVMLTRGNSTELLAECRALRGASLEVLSDRGGPLSDSARLVVQLHRGQTLGGKKP